MNQGQLAIIAMRITRERGKGQDFSIPDKMKKRIVFFKLVVFLLISSSHFSDEVNFFGEPAVPYPLRSLPKT